MSPLRLLVALVVWAAAIAGAAGVSTVVARSIRHTSTTAGSSPAGSGSGAGSGSAPSAPFNASAVEAADSDSLFHAANFARALAIVRSHVGAGARLDSVALYPGYAALTLANNGRESDLYVDASGRYDRTDTGATVTDPVFSLASVLAAGPGTLARRIARGTRIPLSQLHYVVIRVDPDTKQLQWLVYTVPGTRLEYFQAAGVSGPMIAYGANGGPRRVKG